MRALLPPPPNPRDIAYARNGDKWRDDMYSWANTVIGKLETFTRQITTPVGRLEATAFTTATTATARNVSITSPMTVVVSGVTAGTATVTATVTGTGTASDVASANTVATIAQIMIDADIASPNLSR